MAEPKNRSSWNKGCLEEVPFPHAGEGISGNNAMIFKAKIQRFHHAANLAGGRDVGLAGRGITRRMVVRDENAIGFQFKGAPDRTAQRHHRPGSAATGVKVLGNEQAVVGKEQDKDAFLRPKADPASEIGAKIAGSRVDRLAQQYLAGGGIAKLTGRNDDGADVHPAFSSLSKGIGRSRVDRTQRAEAPDQVAGDLFGSLCREGPNERRQDG